MDKWEVLDEVGALKLYVRDCAEGMPVVKWLGDDGDWYDVPPEDAATLQAHRVLDLLAEMERIIDLHYDFKVGCLNWELAGFLPSVNEFMGEFPQAVLAAAKSAELADWRKGK